MLVDLQLPRLTSPWQLPVARGFSALYQAAPVLMAPVPEGGLRPALRTHVDAHLGGSLAGRVPASWLQDRDLQQCLVCGLSVAKRYGIHPTCRPTARAAAGPGPALGPRGPDDGALPSLSEIQCSNTPTLRHVPARARYAWAPRACAAAAEYNDERAWVHLLMLPQPVLCAPPRGGRKPLLLLPWSASREPLGFQELLVLSSSRKGKFSQWACLKAEEPVETTDPSEAEEMVSPSSGESTPVTDEKEAFQLYLQKFGECRDGSNPGYSRKAFPWYSGKLPQGEKVSDESLQAALAYRPQPAKRLNKPNLVEVDSEGEEVPLCTKCSMPVGEFAYQGREGKHTCVHTECMAQVLMKEAQRDEELRNQREQQKKILNRREFDIGWQMDSVPQNARWAARMGCDANPQGLCCLVLDEASRTVKVKATLEPSAAVRKTASREPLFSLDPVDPQNLEQSPQKKVYEPKWLAGTSAGDVIMPVVGMSSVFDFSEMTGKENQWAGREWFVVRKAEVRMAEDKTLIPHVKMGVEAREQVLTKNGLEDGS
eukprot:g5150.t1